MADDEFLLSQAVNQAASQHAIAEALDPTHPISSPFKRKNSNGLDSKKKASSPKKGAKISIDQLHACVDCKRMKKSKLYCRIVKRHDGVDWNKRKRSRSKSAVAEPHSPSAIGMCSRCKSRKKGRTYCRDIKKHTAADWHVPNASPRPPKKESSSEKPSESLESPAKKRRPEPRMDELPKTPKTPEPKPEPKPETKPDKPEGTAAACPKPAGRATWNSSEPIFDLSRLDERALLAQRSMLNAANAAKAKQEAQLLSDTSSFTGTCAECKRLKKGRLHCRIKLEHDAPSWNEAEEDGD